MESATAEKENSMKYAFLFFVMAMLAVMPVVAQSQEETVVVKKSDLTTDQLKKVEAQKITEQIGQYADWANMGRGVGVAIRESLTAVKDVAVDFSQTDIGKFTMFLVAWKIMAKDILAMGNDLVGYLVGISLLVGGLPVIIWSYRRRCVPRRMLVSVSPGPWFKREKKYEIFDPADNRGNMSQTDLFWAHLVPAAALILGCCLIMFS